MKKEMKEWPKKGRRNIMLNKKYKSIKQYKYKRK